MRGQVHLGQVRVYVTFWPDLLHFGCFELDVHTQAQGGIFSCMRLTLADSVLMRRFCGRFTPSGYDFSTGGGGHHAHGSGLPTGVSGFGPTAVFSKVTILYCTVNPTPRAVQAEPQKNPKNRIP